MSRLPERARAKLAGIAQSAADAEALHRASTEKLRVLMHQQHDPRADDATGAALGPEIEEVRALQARRAARHGNDAQVHAQLTRWAETLPRGAVLVEEPPVELDEDDLYDLPGAIAQIRQEIASWREMIRQIATAPPSADELKEKARAYVERLAAAAAPAFDGTRLRFAPVQSEWSSDSTNEKAMRLAAWIDPEALVRRLHAQIDATAAPDGVTAADRAARREAVEQQLLEAEHTEEALVSRAIAGGLSVERRTRADPRAVLGVRVERAAASRAAA